MPGALPAAVRFCNASTKWVRNRRRRRSGRRQNRHPLTAKIVSRKLKKGLNTESYKLYYVNYEIERFNSICLSSRARICIHFFPAALHPIVPTP
jgi:hypothetical protein